MVFSSALVSPALPLFRLTQTSSPTLTLVHSPLRSHLRPLPLRPPRRLSSSPSHVAAAGLPMEELVERDWSFLDADPSDTQRADKARRIIAAANIKETGSKVLAALPTADFIDRVVESAPCELLVAIHESLFVLAMIKESHDRVRCWQGTIDVVPEKFVPFDVVFVCYFPGMGVSVDQLLSSLSRKCSPGARIVLSFDQGRAAVEQNHRQQFPDIVTFDLPDRIVLEKAAMEHSFQIIEFVDEPAFYLAVLRFHDQEK
ncbi:hypothetical protein Cni_G22982 [Canna indica]|uniref:Uncharacterized protein n=1 Tax=Canna indica TaxID=4628 RepID=A0AAQ3KS97_9LILI|nr:hypothetical protein Cni_G22982 [Canna indica]